MTKPEEEIAIRSVVASWIDATRSGDVQAVLDLMTDDALFLSPGQPPMTKAAFEAASRSQAAAKLKIDVTSDIQEVQVQGDLAYLRSQLVVSVISPESKEPITRSGYTLTVYRKVDGKWLLARDANLLTRI